MDARCRSLDGSRIALSSAGFDVSGPVTSIAQVEMAGQICEVTAGSTPELLDHPGKLQRARCREMHHGGGLTPA